MELCNYVTFKLYKPVYHFNNIIVLDSHPLYILGHIADALQVTDPDVYMSSDGGYTWFKVIIGTFNINAKELIQS